MRARMCLTIAMAVGLGLASGSVAAGQTTWSAPGTEKSKKSPVAASAKAVEQGKKVAQGNCVSCHGNRGKGDGAAAVALNPRPADWTSTRIQNESDGELFWKITTGRGAMPAWRHLPESERWALVQYIRTLKK
jgi:mono/diheme cytochrome c family protein